LRETSLMREEFIKAIKSRQNSFNLSLPGDTISRLADYYDLVQVHNPILHLVGPCSATEFATRHILESLTMLEFIPQGARFADVGAGAGLPSIPGLIVRKDLSGLLIESKEKKTKFLADAVKHLGIARRAKVSNLQFEEVDPTNVSHVCCRALDKFEQKLPRLLRWADKKGLLLFGGNNLRTAMEKHQLAVTAKLMPLSEQRYLFVVDPKPPTVKSR